MWIEIRHHYPHQWLLVEAIKAHSEANKRILEELAVVDTFSDSVVAMQRYIQLHRAAPERELYGLHTDREKLEIRERQWPVRSNEPTPVVWPCGGTVWAAELLSGRW
jgi:hypothetical protein